MPKTDQTNMAMFDSAQFVKWMEEHIEQPFMKSRGKKALDRFADLFFNWAKRNSTWPLHWGIMCCAIEMAAASDPIYDVERFGVIYRSTPRQCDVLLLTGPISYKLVPVLKRLYEQMPDPKWVIAMGECSICGGPFHDSYSVVKGAHTVIPVDIYIPGCPARPEALIDGFLKLKDKIKAEKKGTIKTRKGRKVSSRKGQTMDAVTETKALQKGWGLVMKEREKAEIKAKTEKEKAPGEERGSAVVNEPAADKKGELTEDGGA